MTNVYTRRLAAASLESPSANLLYTNTGDSTVIIRDLIVGNPTGEVNNVVIYLQGPGPYWVWASPAVPAFSSDHLEVRQELPAGSQIWATCSTAGVTVLITGYTLSAV